MSDQLDSDVAALRAQLDEVTEQQHRVRAQAEAADAEYERLLAQLKSEFDVGSVDEAQALLDLMETELAQEIERIRVELAKSENFDERAGS